MSPVHSKWSATGDLRGRVGFGVSSCRSYAVVWRLDRLARSLKQLITTVEDLEQRGVGFRSLTEAVNTTTNGGRLVFHIFAALAEFERGIIRERTMAGLEATKVRGRTGGRPSAMNDADITAARAMLRANGISVAEVAERLQVSPSTLYRHLPGGRGRWGEHTRRRGPPMSSIGGIVSVGPGWPIRSLIANTRNSTFLMYRSNTRSFAHHNQLLLAQSVTGCRVVHCFDRRFKILSGKLANRRRFPHPVFQRYRVSTSFSLAK